MSICQQCLGAIRCNTVTDAKRPIDKYNDYCPINVFHTTGKVTLHTALARYLPSLPHRTAPLARTTVRPTAYLCSGDNAPNTKPTTARTMTTHGSNSLKGITYAVLSSSTFGFAPLFTLLLIGFGLSSFEVLTYRWGVASLSLGLLGVLTGHSFRIGLRDFGVICMLGIFRALTSLCLVIAYQNIATGVASSIHFLYPLATAIGMALFFRERLSWKTLVAILASLAGAVLLSANDFTSGGSHAITGIVTACLSVVFYSSYMIGVRKTRAARIDSTALTFYVMLFGAVLFACCGACTTGVRWVSDGRMWLCILGLALPATAISNITLVQAIKHIGPTFTSLFGAMEPLTAMIIGVLAFGERFTWLTAIGMALVIAAVSSVILGNSAPAQQPATPAQDEPSRS